MFIKSYVAVNCTQEVIVAFRMKYHSPIFCGLPSVLLILLHALMHAAFCQSGTACSQMRMWRMRCIIIRLETSFAMRSSLISGKPSM